MSAIPGPVQDVVRARSGGVCEGCRSAPATEMHHRRYRSRGGEHTPSNLLHLCGAGNHTGCHGIAHSKTGHDRGWSVHSWRDPAAEKTWMRGVGFVLLDDEGHVNEARKETGPWR